MIGFRPRLAPTAVTVPVVLLCLGLGAWQIERLQWKQALIAERAAAFAAAPVAPPLTATAARAMEFRPIVDRGILLNDREIFLSAIDKSGNAGFDVVTPLREAGGRIVFVNRGFVPAALRDPARRARGQLDGTIRIVGLLRLPPQRKPSWFVPDNRSDLDYWFWIDLPAMAAANRFAEIAPFYIDADATPNPGGWPRGGVTQRTLPNNHLQYAITWFSLAGAAIVIYLLYHRRLDAR